MNHPRHIAALAAACLVASISWSIPSGHAGPFDSVKKKIGGKADDAAKKAEGAVPGQDKPDSAAAPAATPVAAGGAQEKVSAVSTKFDFVPGDSVLFFDDFGQDELGEFPARWKLAEGTFEVAEMEGERWLRCTSVDGRVRMKLPAMASLPEFWTLEFDFFQPEVNGNAITARALKGDAIVWEATFPQGEDMAFRSGDIISTTPLEGASVGDRHHISFMARQGGLKGYMNRQRMVNVPEIPAPDGMPDVIELRLWSPSQPMITKVRFAEGCRPPKDMLAEGKLVTYGIHFASGSDVVLPESAPVLRQIAGYLEANPTVKLQVTGHTDNVGSAESNLDLSQRRATSVARVLTQEFSIAADRFTTAGKGDTEALASNASSEGRAMNRRVEFAKM